jgi:predicted homoserine dehydrogenase-like protein
MAENADIIDRDRLLPLGIALGCHLIRHVPKDQALTFADVFIPAGRTVDPLYAEQQARFPTPAAETELAG